MASYLNLVTKGRPLTLSRIKTMIPDAKSTGLATTVEAPFDRSPIAEVEQVDEAAVELALQRAAELFADRDGWLPIPERIAILEKTASIMSGCREELAIEAAREGGKPVKDSLVETDRAIDGVKNCVEEIRTRRGTEIPMNLNAASANRYSSTCLEPIGPVVSFSAFNHPLNLIVHQVAPAVATGCPVIVKPAEATPLSCFRFVEILREAGLPPEWCQACLTKDHDVSERLFADPRVAFFSFIGSYEVGWKLRSKLAPGTRCALEHGGVAPVIVATDADVDDMIPLLARGGFYHAGQVCVSVQKVFVAREIARKVADELARAASDMKVGDPTLKETDVGPLIRHAEVERVAEWVNEATERGAELVCGGNAISETTFAPTVLFDPPCDVKVSTAEVFGPVVCVYPVDSVDQAIKRANALPFAFQASVFTANLDTAFRVSRRIAAATVMVNDHTAFRVDWMPFAAIRQSGLGIGGIPYTLRDMQIEKQIVWRSKEL